MGNAESTTTEVDQSLPPKEKGERTEPRLAIFYGSNAGTAKGFATALAGLCQDLTRTNRAGNEVKVPVAVIDMAEYEPEDLAKEAVAVFLISSYEANTPPINAKNFCAWLDDTCKDFRVNKTHLSKLQFTVFGVGDSIYGKDFNSVGRSVLRWLTRLGANPFCSAGRADVSVSRDDQGTADTDFQRWVEEDFLPGIHEILEDGVVKTRAAGVAVEDEEESASGYSDMEDNEPDAEMGSEDDGNLDIEDIGAVINKWQEKQKEEATTELPPNGERRDMLNPKLRKSLEKQGYKLIGSHSGVKLCRWTKSMLRGRGGCYKHTLYGISSYQCMEMTPSLACANKCTFCWRHHTNPVGKEWKWNMDDAKMLVEESLRKHRELVKVMKGVPGVKPERLAEAMKIKHCALSLVGEPIMYPAVNEYLKLLHSHGISSFMVTNAQFPDRIETLDPVTQLYVSIDASNKAELKAIDRPIFSDFWERFLTCLKAIRDKELRTVYRLTLVKGQNMGNAEQYAKLVQIGRPTFIEVKGVTFSGPSNTGGMRMENIPWHQEVRDFCEELASFLPGDYELACEHSHSCCVLIADTRLKIDGKWHTWIDYDKFHELQKEYHENGTHFNAMDYLAPTPDWALYGSKEEGFDPEEVRHKRIKGQGMQPVTKQHILLDAEESKPIAV